MNDLRIISAISDTYSDDDFDDNADSDTQNALKFHNDSRTIRRRTPSFKLNRHEGHVREMTMKHVSKIRKAGGANSMPILRREKESDRDFLGRIVVKKRNQSNRNVSYEPEKRQTKNRALSSSLKTIRGLQSALKVKEDLVEELIKENKILKRLLTAVIIK